MLKGQRLNLQSKEYDITMEIRYTTAPVGFDGFGSIDHGIVAETDSWFGASKPIRKVEIQPLHLSWQENRYWSGNHPVWPELPPSVKRLEGKP